MENLADPHCLRLVLQLDLFWWQSSENQADFEHSIFQIVNHRMNYPSLSLSKELIASAFLVKTNDPGKTNDNLLKCTKCEYNTDKKNYLDNHTRGKHPKSKTKCKMCDFSHAFPSKIKQHHTIVHLGIKRLDYKFRCKVDSCQDFGKNTCEDLEQHSLVFCNQCEHTTRRNEDLKYHVSSVHEGIVYPCEQCSYVSKWNRELKLHVKSKHTTMFFFCEEETCSFETYSRTLLGKHFESEHEGIVKYKCEYMNCGKISGTRSGLRKHILRKHQHQEETKRALFKDKCEYMDCGKIFGTRNGLRKHILRKHQEETKSSFQRAACSPKLTDPISRT